ncbi:vascular endothelial zinc finger 1b isoform X3 [Tachysurus fulvidraco]|uniref:vascular endothelial zinc finger 1b isoform X3 n=1 Tax=Tachysurus fulvidraco TaxID=1234273 RepID=UPI001FF061CE|nr:vascular endothelial zinc finger 1b isoform X3 [Tachysurus fulvidraco]
MEPSWSSFLFQTNDTLHHQHQVGQNSLLPLLNAGTEPQDQKPVLPIPLEQKPPVSAAELLKDTMAGGTGGGGPVVVKKEPKSKTPFICGYCSKSFRDSYHLRRHESCHTGIKMVSRPKKTPAAPTMVPMISTVPQRDSNGNPTYVSAAGILTTGTNSVAVGTMATLSQQQPSVPKKPPKPVKKNHGCEMCGKAFRDVYHLNRHKLSHSDEKPFECPICHQRFKRKDRMTYHVRSHDGGVHKPYICSVCGKGFSRPDHLSCHVKHVHSTERPFKCQVTACTSAFATKDRLRSHMIRHEGKVTCNICGKMLSAAYITSHLKTHSQAGFTSPCNKGTPALAPHSSSTSSSTTSSWPPLTSTTPNQDGTHSDTNNTCNSASATPVTASATTASMNRGTISNPVTISSNTVNITAPVSLQHPVTITAPVNIASVNIPATATGMNIAHPVAISTPMSMNITGPLNIAMRPMESMQFLSQVLPSSPPW